jgi:hypothetical protein
MSFGFSFRKVGDLISAKEIRRDLVVAPGRRNGFPDQAVPLRILTD